MWFNSANCTCIGKYCNQNETISLVVNPLPYIFIDDIQLMRREIFEVIQSAILMVVDNSPTLQLLVY